MASFTVAHNTQRFNQQSQQWEDGEPCFIECALWGKKGENFVNGYHKAPVLVLGKLVQEHWQDKQTGANRSRHKIVADDASMIPIGTPGTQQQGQGAWGQPQPHAQPSPPF